MRVLESALEEVCEHCRFGEEGGANVNMDEKGQIIWQTAERIIRLFA